MNIPVISIIIPVYNAENVLRQCLDSILSQSFSSWEAILVNDGSKDNSGSICEEYASRDQRFRVYHKENGGASSARNVGLNYAIGEWVTFIDSDDTIAPDYFKTDSLQEVNFAVQRWRFSTESETREELTEGLYRGDDFFKFMSTTLHKDILRMVAAKFLRRDIINDNHIRFDENIVLGEDTIFMLEYYRYINAVSVNNTSYYLYYRPNNWGETKYCLKKEQVRYFFSRFYQEYKLLGIESDDLVHFMTNFYMNTTDDKKSFFGRIYLKTIPEYLVLNKTRLKGHSVVSRVKYMIFRMLSLLR